MACLAKLQTSRVSNPCKREAGYGNVVYFLNRADVTGGSFNSISQDLETVTLAATKLAYKWEGVEFGYEKVATQVANSNNWDLQLTLRFDYNGSLDLNAIMALAKAKDLIAVIPTNESGYYEVIGINNSLTDQTYLSGLHRETTNLPSGRNSGDETDATLVFKGISNNPGLFFKAASGTNKAYFDALL